MITHTTPSNGPTPWQRELLERREKLMPVIAAILAQAGITGEINPQMAFSEIFVKVAGAKDQDRPLPIAYVTACVRSFVADELRNKKCARQAEEQFAFFQNDVCPKVGGLPVDGFDLKKVLRAIEPDGSLCNRLARALVERVQEKHPTQVELAKALGVGQSCISRAMPAALRLLRETINSMEFGSH